MTKAVWFQCLLRHKVHTMLAALFMLSNLPTSEWTWCLSLPKPNGLPLPAVSERVSFISRLLLWLILWSSCRINQPLHPLTVCLGWALKTSLKRALISLNTSCRNCLHSLHWFLLLLYRMSRFPFLNICSDLKSFKSAFRSLQNCFFFPSVGASFEISVLAFLF